MTTLTNTPAGSKSITSRSSTSSRKIKIDNELTCNLTSAELQQRKATVISSLKKQILEKKELKNGFAYKFKGSDTLVDELISFVKSERECCNYFTFNLSITGDKSEAWLEIVGPVCQQLTHQ
jgi:hypothetical protein